MSPSRPRADAGTSNGDDDSLITLTEAAERLGVHYMTAYGYVRTGRLPAVRDGAQWRVQTSDIDAFRAPPAVPAAQGRKRRTDYGSLLEERMVVGDEAGAWRLVEQALTSSKTPARVYVEMLIPALQSIGDRWERGELTVADEHQASTLAHRLIGRLGPQFVHRGRRRGVVVIGAVAGDQHSLPTALLADLLRDRSFTVVDLGANTPVDSFVDALTGAERLVGVGICMTAPGLSSGVAETVHAVKRAASVPVVVGGSAIADEAQALASGADAWAADGPGAVELFIKLAARPID